MDNIEFNIHLGEDLQVVKPNFTGIQNWSCYSKVKGHGHLDLITSGNIEIKYEGKKYTASANTIICIPKDKEYYFRVSGNYSYYSFFFEYTTNTDSNDFVLPLCFKPENIQYYKDKYKHAYKQHF